MRKKLILALLLAIPGILMFEYLARTTIDLPLRQTEEKIGTDGEHNWSFHRILEEKNRHGFHFPGYLIGIEKAQIQALDIADDQQSVFADSQLSSAPIAKVRDFLNDSDRLFLSHIVKYSVKHERVPRVGSEVLYSVYDLAAAVDTPLPFGDRALEILYSELDQVVRQSTYTHILLVSMGWNTPQLEAIGDINSLVGQLMGQVEADASAQPFHPLIIGVTWPSQSSLSRANYISKAYDADELGVVWIRRLITDVLHPLQKKHALKVLMLGHSLGARALTMGLFSSQWNDDGQDYSATVDAVIGYEPAFSIKRFIPNQGVEGSPFASFDALATRFVFTWSEHDAAMRIGRYYLTSHMGGAAAAKIAQQYPGIFTSVEVADPNLLLALNEPARVLHIDASSLLKHRTFDSSGGAHSDIFRPEVASFLWRVIKASDGSARE